VRAADALKDFTTDNPEEDAGVELVLKAASAPLRQIAVNAGNIGEVVLSWVLDSKDPAVGYNAATQKTSNMFEEGVIDPTKVCRIALENASSVASSMLTTECAIGFEEEEHAHVEHMGM
jgi:chaperonin GroEL